MISSRWPRPMGTRASTAFIPVNRGSRTDWRDTIPGALTSTRLLRTLFKGPLPSMGWPRASSTRPRLPGPMGTFTICPVRYTRSPWWMSVSAPKTTIPTWSDCRFRAMPLTPLSKHTSSPACTLFSPYTRAIPSPTDRTRPRCVTGGWYCFSNSLTAGISLELTCSIRYLLLNLGLRASAANWRAPRAMGAMDLFSTASAAAGAWRPCWANRPTRRVSCCLILRYELARRILLFPFGDKAVPPVNLFRQ
mmetsp:Transcript_10325/g.26895  ORF Transcript_10325/g.26895 Transcript_10325/m.26895 type:complete len:249 (+) Transcript_10325:1766-2512(+)